MRTWPSSIKLRKSTMNNKLISIVISVIFCAASISAQAHEHHSHETSAPVMTDAQVIEYTMKKLFDKPEAPLAVMPISIEGDYAVAGWVQSGKGGRALLKKEASGWRIQVCGGDGLKKAATLEQTGMPTTTASRLAKSVDAAEAKLPSEHLKKLAMFEGMMKVEPSGHDAQDAHHKH